MLEMTNMLESSGDKVIWSAIAFAQMQLREGRTHRTD
jgi:hypothetical protein